MAVAIEQRAREQTQQRIQREKADQRDGRADRARDERVALHEAAQREPRHRNMSDAAAATRAP